MFQMCPDLMRSPCVYVCLRVRERVYVSACVCAYVFECVCDRVWVHECVRATALILGDRKGNVRVCEREFVSNVPRSDAVAL